MVSPTSSQWSPQVGYIPIYDANLAVKNIQQLATQGQTVLNLVGASYRPNTNSILVYKNGLLLTKNIDYAEEDPITIRLTNPANLNDRLVFVLYTEIHLYSQEPYNTALRVDIGQGPLQVLPLRAERAGKFLSFDANGQPIANISATEVQEALADIQEALILLDGLDEALALKAPLDSPVFTGIVQGINKAMVGLGNADNTSDLAKPISTAAATAINAKLNISDFTKANLSLGNVDNTSDLAKPISTATQTAINLKANLASPTFTGSPAAPTPTAGTNSTRIATTAFTMTAIATAIAAIPVPTKADIGLGNVDNTSDLSKPVSTATQTALNAKANTSALAAYAPLDSPTFTGTVSGVTKAMVGLGNADNTSDAAKPISTATQTALNAKANLASPTFTGSVNAPTVAVGNNNTIVATTAFVKLAIAAIPPVTKESIGLGNVDNTSDMDKPVSTATQEALAAVVAGDLEPALAGKANVNNTNLTGAMTAEAATFSGAVTFNAPVTGIDKSEVGLGNADNTSDANKPVSTAQQTALNAKANLASPTFTGSPAVPLPAASDNTNRIASTSWVNTAITTGLGTVTKASVGLGNADNTSDANKPVSTAQQAALDLKANLASPTFTGTVAGITKAMVGLGNADNTSDTAKPVSTAQQTALNLKANLASPALTGTPTAPTAAAGTNTTQIATTAHVLAGLNLKANLASPTFTGTPAAPTPAAGTNTTQLATTAFVTAGIAAAAALQVAIADLQNWITYTPTVTPTSGTYNATSASGRYIRVGNFVMFNITGNVTDKGTGAVPTINLPFNIAAGDFNIFAGRASGGSMVQAQGSAGSSRVTVFTYNNTNPLDTSTSFTIQGCFLCS